MLRPNNIKRYKKVQASFKAFSEAKSGIIVRGVDTPKWSVKQCIQKTADKHDLSFARVERILKMDLTK